MTPDYSIVERNEKWGDRFDIYLDGDLITTSESRADAEGYIQWHKNRVVAAAAAPDDWGALRAKYWPARLR